jgi:hypothetical protein
MLEKTKHDYKTEALSLLTKNASFILDGDDLIWKDENQTQPSDEEIQTEMQRLEIEYSSNEYQRLRSNDYPSISDQLDMLYWDRKNNTNNWETSIDDVKDKYPKGA